MSPALLLTLLAAGPAPVELRAEHLLWATTQEVGAAEGDAVLEAQGATLRARVIAFDRKRQLAWATGDVRGDFESSSGRFTLQGESLALRFEGDQVTEIFALDGTLERRAGNRAGAQLKAEHMVREDGEWLVGGATLVPCACKADEPVLTVRASDAALDFDAQRASLWWPTVRIYELPVLWAPWLSLPLTARQTGLLFPKPSFTVLNGFSFEQPLFITLGPSYDLTLTPGYFFGGPNPFAGIQGPRLGTEFRYAPTVTSSGRVAVGVLFDLKAPRDPVTSVAAAQGLRGPRFEAQWQHRQDLGAFRARVDASLVSDGFLFRDLTTDVLAREAGYLRSAASLAHVTETSWVGVDAVLRQDLTFGFPVLPLPATTPAALQGPNPLQRLPGFTAAMPLRPLVGPLSGGIALDWVRLAPTTGGTGDEGVQGNEGAGVVDATPVSVECLRERLYWPSAASAACPEELRPMADVARGDRRYQPGEREARHRWSLVPRLSLAVPLGDLLQLEANAGWRQLAWVGEVTGRASTFGAPVLGATLGTELARDFGTLRHTVSPAAELRAVPFTVGSAAIAYDELDRALGGEGRAVQAVGRIRQRLTRPGGELAMLEVGQGVDLTPGAIGVSETFARGRLRLGPVVLDGAARFDPLAVRISRASAAVSLDDGRGDGLYGSYERLLAEGSALQRASVDLLFGGVAPQLSRGASQAVTFGGRLKLKDFRLRYDVLLGDRVWGGGAPVLTLTQHGVGVTWTPACDCLTVDVAATQRLDDSIRSVPSYRLPDFSASITIGNFGALGIAR
ncbi:MAG: LPS assembly protein LptD [Myxococcaceae bacterium]|nr:LPS assembly protein LptD [Myxococcaceae bacterium]